MGETFHWLHGQHPDEKDIDTNLIQTTNRSIWGLLIFILKILNQKTIKAPFIRRNVAQEEGSTAYSSYPGRANSLHIYLILNQSILVLTKVIITVKYCSECRSQRLIWHRSKSRTSHNVLSQCYILLVIPYKTWRTVNMRKPILGSSVMVGSPS